MKKFILILFSLCLLACNEKIFTIEQFKSDNTLLRKYLNKCQNGELHPEDLNCINSKKANEKLIIEREKAEFIKGMSK